MKKLLILLLLVSMCGGSEQVQSEISENTANTSQTEDTANTSQTEDTASTSQTEDTEKPSTSYEDSDVSNEIFWGATEEQPEVYAADDVSQETIDLLSNGSIKP